MAMNEGITIDRKKIDELMRLFSEKEMSRVVARALSKTGSKAKRKIQKTLEKAMGARSQGLKKHIHTTMKPQASQMIEDQRYGIRLSGFDVPLSRFNPNQTGSGVSHTYRGSEVPNPFPSGFMLRGKVPVARGRVVGHKKHGFKRIRGERKQGPEGTYYYSELPLVKLMAGSPADFAKKNPSVLSQWQAETMADLQSNLVDQMERHL